MATGGVADPVKQLEDQITCTVCLEIFDTPRTLPCLHSFCQSCLEKVPLNKQGSKYMVACPNCRRESQVPPDPKGVTGFPAAFQINTLKEVYDKLKKMKSDAGILCENCHNSNATGHCEQCKQFLCVDCIDTHMRWSAFSLHKITSLNDMAHTSVTDLLKAKKKEVVPYEICSKHEKPLELFCETCDEIICHNCTVRLHKDHKFDLITDTFEKHRGLIESALKPVGKEIARLDGISKGLSTRSQEIEERRISIKENIGSMVDQVISLLRRSEGELAGKVDTLTNDELEKLEVQSKEVNMALSDLKSCEEFVRQSLEIGNQQQILTSKKQMMERMATVVKQLNVKDSNSQTKEEFALHFTKDTKVIECAKSLGEVVLLSANHLQDCKIRPVAKNQLTVREKVVSFPLAIEDSSSLLMAPPSSVTCNVVPEGQSKTVPSKIEPTDHSGIFKVTCQPYVNGTHEVTVAVNKHRVGVLSVSIPFNPYLEQVLPVTALLNLDSPYGVAVNPEGYVAVVECSSNTVSVLDPDGKKIRSIGGKDDKTQVKFNYPRGVAFTHDNFLLVSDNHKLQKITMQGELVKCIGKSGFGDLEFNTPCGITVTADGTVYIVESSNHRVQVLKKDLTFSHKFGVQGSGAGQFTRPRDIAFDTEGNSYITDAGNHRIQKFSAQGQYVCQISRGGSGVGQLSRPHGIAVDDAGLVHVAEVANHRISTFTSDGQFVRCFGEEGSGRGQFKGAGGMTISSKGQLYVCDFYNKRVAVY